MPAMKMKTAPALLLLFALCMIHHITEVESWSSLNSFWRKCRAVSATATIVTTQVLLPFHAGAETTPSINQPPAVVRESSSAFEKDLIKSLSAPTQERPQIKIPANVGSPLEESGPTPIVQGLVYLADPTSERRPGPMDTLVLTAGSLSNPTQALAGARIPISKCRFPMSFRMFKENVVSGKADEWLQVEQEQDILVTARICPEGVTVPCSNDQTTLKAQGVSKLVRNLPGQPEGVRLRAAASLPLQ